jgi:hypothetical protein
MTKDKLKIQTSNSTNIVSNGVLWDIEYYLNKDHTSRKLTAQLYGKTMDEVQDKFKGWYPETYIWRIYKNIV